jgi:hypothetical protein
MNNKLPWQNQLKGAFAFDTAPFAVHPNDEKRAVKAVSAAIRDGANKNIIELEIADYLKKKNCDDEFIKNQISIFRVFFRKQYKKISNCFVLSKPVGENKKFVYIFSGRDKFDQILYHAMHIYHEKEINNATVFMRAKKKSWPTFAINFHEFPAGGLWSGLSYIGLEPEYILEKSDAWLSSGLDAELSVIWLPKPIPADPGPTWEGRRYHEKWGYH